MMLHVLAVFLVDAGLALALLGIACLVRPVRFLRIGSRRRAAAVLAASACLLLVGLGMPAPESHVDRPESALDEIVPTYQFSERHEIHVAAAPPRVFEAILSVTADEITLFRTLTTIRRLGRAGPESILNAPGRKPILDVATQTSFLLLAKELDREVVVGTLVHAPPGFSAPRTVSPEWYRALQGPGYAKAVMNFSVRKEGAGSRVITETRILATDASTRRRFAVYWRVIYPGSAVIRRMWLRAIERRAEGGSR